MTTNEWHQAEDGERDILVAPDGTSNYWWKMLPRINALTQELADTRANVNEYMAFVYKRLAIKAEDVDEYDRLAAALSPTNTEES